MNQPTLPITIEKLANYTADDAAGIGRLLPHLSARFSDKPVSEAWLRQVIDSPHHDQLVARDNQGTIVGTATLSLTLGAGVVRKAWLEDFVVDPHIRGAGIGSQLWDAMIDWCRDHSAATLIFTSSPHKAATDFYLKRGAVIRETNFFKKSID